ncbi:transposase [Clostridium thermarum]|uniref:transposase n=1 Tax=Clostridium thermarum TaxID=1716543 RepID=UPI00111E3927|nr:transposase [Clostridium thermarum]
MPRQARKYSKSGIYHIMVRGINKQNIFEEDEDRERFIKTLKYYKEISKYEIYAYCLMTNHVHLLIRETMEPISLIMQRINGSYGIWYNTKYERCGYLFQGRFKSEPVEDKRYFQTVFRYIHQNPLKANLVKDIKGWKWSSLNEYYDKVSFIDTDYVLDMFSEDKESALEKVKHYLSEANEDTCMEYEEKRKLTDEEIINFFIKLGIKNISELQQSEKLKRDDIIKKVKAIKGVTVRQLARITGISRSVIGRM